MTHARIAYVLCTIAHRDEFGKECKKKIIRKEKPKKKN